MKLERTVSLPQLWLVAAARGAMGFGMGLLLSERMSYRKRRAIGKTLLLTGLATAVPLAIDVLRQK